MENNKDYQYYLSKYSIGRHKLSENSFVDVNNRNIIFFKYSIDNKRQWHRFDGPAWISSENKFDVEWFINDKQVTDLITKWADDNGIDLDNLSPSDVALIKLTWADYGK